MKNLTLSIVLFSLAQLYGQSVIINEVVSSNSIYIDEDGDTPDWIELYNYGSQDINLQNWTF